MMRAHRKNGSNGAAFCVLLAALLIVAPAAFADDTYEKEFNLESGGKIELEMKYGGSLHAEGWDRDVVRIECEETRNGLDEYEFEIELKNNKLLRFTAHPEDDAIASNNLKVKLMVPKKCDIEVHSGGGGITIIGVEGEFEGATGGGSIRMQKVKGKADLSTGGGLISIHDSELDGRVSTGGGEVQVRDVVGNVVAQSGGGNVSYRNVRDRDGRRRMPNGLADEGDNDISEETIVRSTAGGGMRLSEAPGGAILLTGGGNIIVRNAEDFVKATTGGGSIRIEIHDGSVRAVTGSGDIEVEVTGDLGEGDDGVHLTTGNGDIELILPADISAQLEFDLAYTRNSNRNYEIESDFDITLKRTDEWETRHGSPRKHIYGTGKLGGGKYLIKISCVNGNIRLRKRG